MNSLRIKSWLAVIACAVSIFNSGALFFGYPGLMTAYWQDMFNASSKECGYIMTFACLGVGLMMFLSGSIHSKIGTRKCFIIGSAILAADMLIANFATSIYWCYIWSFLCGAGNGFIYGPGVTTVQNWMPQKKDLHQVFLILLLEFQLQ